MRAILTFIALASALILTSCLALPSYASESTDTIQVADKATDLLSNLTASIEKIAEKHGPQVADLTLEAVRWLAISNLVIGFVFSVLVYLSIQEAVRFNKKSLEKAATGNLIDDGSIEMGRAVSCTIAALSCFVVALAHLGVQTWVSVFNPTLGLAMSVIDKFI